MIISECHECGDYKYLPLNRKCQDCVCNIEVLNIEAHGDFTDGREVGIDKLSDAIGNDCIIEKKKRSWFGEDDASCFVLVDTIVANGSMILYGDGTVSIEGESKEKIQEEYNNLKDTLLANNVFPVDFSDIEFDFWSGKIDIDLDDDLVGELENEDEFESIDTSITTKFKYNKGDISCRIHINRSGEIKIYNCTSKQELDKIASELVNVLAD